MKICQRCVLPETFPGITFDEDGICNYCHRDESALEKAGKKKEKYRKRLDQLIESVKNGDSAYNAIVAYSGGKDSTYTLKLLKDRYNLRLLALTFDNHFISQTAWENIQKVTDELQIDSIRFRPPWLLVKTLFTRAAKEDIFPAPTLLRASAICTACIGIIKSIVLKTALEMSIPLVGFGWSPGQAPIQSAIMKTNPSFLRQTQSAIKKAYPHERSNGMEQYFIPEPYYEIYQERFPFNIHPLAFFDYNEEEIKAELKGLGWQAPTDTDTNSTNCLLNAFANQCHIDRHGFHPYVWEIANMVRQGVMSRDEGIEKIYMEQNQELVNYAKERLEL
jgi:predicted PP-loop superfamily ATPase